ncbi:MAG: hypothetical protein WDN00_00650 [Limisphaerales bacterium]
MDKDPVEAVKWFSQAAEQGQGESQHSLGLRYLWGNGVDADPEKAAAWFTAGRQPGHSRLRQHGWRIFIGMEAVCRPTPVEAYKWMILAGDKFNINHRDGVTIDQFAAQLTPAQIAEAQQRVKNFVPQRTGPEDF